MRVTRQTGEVSVDALFLPKLPLDATDSKEDSLLSLSAA